MTRVRLIGPPQADGEYVGLVDGEGAEEIVHLHDYPRLYAQTGLYEHIVQELLGCRSPQVAAQAFARLCAQRAIDPAELVVLDLGAGTGLVAELLAPLRPAALVGLDLLPGGGAHERVRASWLFGWLGWWCCGFGVWSVAGGLARGWGLVVWAGCLRAGWVGAGWWGWSRVAGQSCSVGVGSRIVVAG